MKNNKNKWNIKEQEVLDNLPLLRVDEVNNKKKKNSFQNEKLAVCHKRIIENIAENLNEVFNFGKNEKSDRLKKVMLSDLKSLKKQTSLSDLKVGAIITKVKNKCSYFDVIKIDRIQAAIKIVDMFSEIIKNIKLVIKDVNSMSNSDMGWEDKISFFNDVSYLIEGMSIKYHINYGLEVLKIEKKENKLENVLVLRKKTIMILDDLCDLLSEVKIKCDNDALGERYSVSSTFVTKMAFESMRLGTNINLTFKKNASQAERILKNYIDIYKQSEDKKVFKESNKEFYIKFNRLRKIYKNIESNDTPYKKKILTSVCNILEDVQINKNKYIFNVNDLYKVDYLYLMDEKYKKEEVEKDRGIQEEIFTFNLFSKITNIYVQYQAREANLFGFDDELGQRLLDLVNKFQGSDFYRIKKISEEHFDEYYMYANEGVLNYYLLKDYLEKVMITKSDNSNYYDLEVIVNRLKKNLKEFEYLPDLKNDGVIIAYLDNREVNIREDLNFIEKESFGLMLKLPKRFNETGVELLSNLIDSVMDDLLINIRQQSGHNGMRRAYRNINNKPVKEEVGEKPIDIFKRKLREHDLHLEMKGYQQMLASKDMAVGKPPKRKI